MSQALYRKYRSKSLADIVGQDHITDILTRALKAGRVAHAYLLTGPRGVGKTSVARILAHEINQLPYDDDSNHLDIIEIDAASNNGVEDVRDLREKVRLAPVSASKKIYIIDEVHMLSKPAFNALLKTLEEPPSHVVFILATTDVEKLPATIVSRTQRFGFRAITEDDAVKHLKAIAKKEGISIDDASLRIIAQRGDGSFRDSISLLDQLASLADQKEGITAELVETSLGLAPQDVIETLVQATTTHDVAAIVKTLDTVHAQGVNAATITDQLINALRSRVVEKPALLQLLDALLDVSRSSYPELKLLSTLGNYGNDAPVEPPRPSVSLAKSAPTPAPAKSKTETHTSAPESPKTVALAAPVLEVSATVKALSKSKPFNWDALVEYVQEHHLALYSVLSKCGHELNGSDLTLFAGSAFYKKKLDDPKYSGHLYESLETLGTFQLTVHTVPTPPPLKDSQAASVAVIMGGGVEVSPDAS